MYSNTAARASARVRNQASWTRSVLSEAKKLSMGALSRQLPRRLIDGWMPCRSSTARYGPAAYCPGSSGRRNTLREEVAMTVRKRRSDRSGRGALPSPGRPSVARREDHRQFWAAIAAGRAGEGGAGGGAGGAAAPAPWRAGGGGGWGGGVASRRGTLVPEGGRHATIASRAGGEAAVRALSVVCRAGGNRDLARATARGARDRPPARARAVHDLPRAAPQRRHAQRRFGVPGHDRAMACRPIRPPSQTSQAGDQRAAAALRAGPARRSHHRPERGSGARAGRAVDGPPARASTGPAVGPSVEPGTDRPPSAARLP